MSTPGVLTLAKGRRKIAFVTTANAPASWAAVSLATDITSKWVELSCAVARDNFALGYTDSDTVDDSPLCTTTNVKAFDASNFEAKMAVYRFLQASGAAGTADTAWTTLGTKGVTGFLLERTSPLALASVDWTAADVGIAYPVKTDNPQQPSDLTGYTKRVIPFSPDGDPIVFTVAA